MAIVDTSELIGAKRKNPATCRSAGFTLIELLASMAVLIFIVLLMSRMFTEASSIWSQGSKRILTASEGRAIMDFMVNELTQAMADDVLTFKLNSGDPGDFAGYGVPAYGADSDELYFAGAVQPGYFRNMRNVDQYAYFIAPMLDTNDLPMAYRYRLARTRRTESMFSTSPNRDKACYNEPEWWKNMQPNSYWLELPGFDGQGCETIAENVAAFEVWAYSEEAGGYKAGYYSGEEDAGTFVNDNLLPMWADIYLELLSEEDAERLAILWAGSNPQAAKEYLARNVKRFTARVFFPNRERALAFKQ